jgi:2-polyprenyl-3-methyl-5-hydroxy-6-metoxy-1,4-benzoquinol methylase
MPTFKVINSRDSYADGAESELLRILKNVSDVSSDSDELQRYITDWPTDYHLNRERNNILLPLEIRPGMKILDVGGGTGVATRYLAEKGANVTLLEGELSRALVAQERCRDLKNVEIIVGEVDDLEAHNQYDLILVIGVLEYIGLNNAQQWLKKLEGFLGHDGQLALAIENRLGMKYFLGYPEDHTGQYWDGILNYYGKDAPRTYAKKELKELLNNVGLEYSNWWYPFPDYKMPLTILSEQALIEFDSEELAKLIKKPFQSAGFDSLLTFSGGKLIESISNAGLLDQLANSFLVICSKHRHATPANNSVIFGSDPNYRKNKYRKRKILINYEEGLIWNECKLKNEENEEDDIVDFAVKSREFFRGETLLQEVKKRSGDLTSNIIAEFRINIPNIISTTRHKTFNKVINPYLPGEFCNQVLGNFDIGLDNFIKNDERITFFDQEWNSKKGVCLELGLLRSLMYFYMNSDEYWNDRFNDPNLTLWDHLHAVTRAILGTTHHTMLELVNAEIWLLDHISVLNMDCKSEEMIASLVSKPRSFFNEGLPLDEGAMEVLKKRYEPIFRLNDLMDSKNVELDSIYNSKSWKLAVLIRSLKKLFTRKNSSIKQLKSIA